MARAAAAALVCLAVMAFTGAVTPGGAALAAQTHAYDPTLSLTGSCVVSAVDPKPDPGPCPGTTGTKEADHPPVGFLRPCGTVTDRYGDIYVASPILDGKSISVGGRIDVFNAEGKFLVEFEDKEHTSCGLAVDSEGKLYTGGIEENPIDVYEPEEFPPTRKTKYSLVKELDIGKSGCPYSSSLAIDPSNDRLYVGRAGCGIGEYGSAKEGWPLIKEIPSISGVSKVSGLDVYGKNHDIYVAGVVRTGEGTDLPSKLVVLDGGSGEIKCEVLGTKSGEKDFEFGAGASLAVDQSNGDAYISTIKQTRVYHFAVAGKGECGLVDSLTKPFPNGFEPAGDIAVDAPLTAGDPTYKSPNSGYVFVTSGRDSSNSNLFAFKLRIVGPPQILKQAANGIGETEAVLEAELNPGNLATTYHFEYTTQASFKAEGYAGASRAPVSEEATAGEGGAFTDVSAPIAGLEPGTAYRLRLIASNCAAEEAAPNNCLTIGEGKAGEEGADVSFATYATPPLVESCPNEALRTGRSAALTDCRAYELVTPPDTDGHIPTMGAMGSFGYGDIDFNSPMASADGASLIFGSHTGALPGIGGSGSYDTFQALREEDGWQSHFTGMTGAQSEKPMFGGISADHSCAFWNAEFGNGELVTESGTRSIYLRCSPLRAPSPHCGVEAEPEGRFEWLACGSLDFDPQAAGKWIGEGGDHVIFMTGSAGGGPGVTKPVQLEPCAPPSGVRAIYDRTPGGPTQCVSVPPAGASAETKSQFETESPTYGGASVDGSVVAFTLAGTLYARLDNATTVEIASGKTAFGGFSADGSRAFYLAEPSVEEPHRGEIYACEVALGPCAGPAATQEPIRIGEGGESVLVNVSADGSRVYFSSPKLLDGEAGEKGKDNLYVWDGGTVRFVAVLDPLDLDDKADGQGLGLWVGRAIMSESYGSQGAGSDPSRSTPDGSVLVFQSHAELTGQAGDGHWQIFRYDTGAAPGEQISCLSCNPTGSAADSDAQLQILGGEFVLSLPPTTALAQIANVSSDGKKAFFQSAERLVSADLDGKLDVYEWEAEGSGGCERAGGCLALISGARSLADEYLYAATPNGRDVFFLSGDTLLNSDPDATPSIYDARENGGFAEAAPKRPPCLGEACQPSAAAPENPTPASSSFEGQGDPKPKRGQRCSAAKRTTAHRAGKGRCAAKHNKKKGRHHHRRAAR